MNDYLPTKDALLNAFGVNFNNQCNTFASELSLTLPELSTISALTVDFGEKMQELTAAKSAYEAAVKAKDSSKEDMVSMIRTYAREFKGNPSVSQSTLAALGVLSSGTTGPVIPVTELVALGCSNGENKLSWNKGNNGQGTNFVIQARFGSSLTWQFVAVVTASRFIHTNQVPGQQVTYRIISNRAGINSNPCDPFVLYPSEGTGSLTLEAAA